MGQNALGQPDYRILNQIYLQSKMMRKLEFLHVDTDSWEVEVD